MEKVYLVWWSNAEEYPEDFEEGTAGIYSTSAKAIAKAEKMLAEKYGTAVSVVVYEVIVDDADENVYLPIFRKQRRKQGLTKALPSDIIKVQKKKGR